MGMPHSYQGSLNGRKEPETWSDIEPYKISQSLKDHQTTDSERNGKRDSHVQMRLG